MNHTIRILIADNDIDFAKGLKKYLEQWEDIKVIGIVRDGQGAVDGSRDIGPDLVLMDLHLPVLDSVKAIQCIVAQNTRVRILAISSNPNDRYAIEAVKAGASGYLEKNNNVDNEAMINTIRQVAQGDVSLNPALAVSILKEFHRIAEA